MTDFIELLNDLEDYFEGKADAEWNGERNVPNKEMILHQRVSDLINVVEQIQELIK